MHTCPHCKEPGIRTSDKLVSVAFAPATCTLCGQRSYLHIIHALIALMMWIILTWIFIGLALYQQMSIYLIGTIPSFILAIDKGMLNAPMRPCG